MQNSSQSWLACGILQTLSQKVSVGWPKQCGLGQPKRVEFWERTPMAQWWFFSWAINRFLNDFQTKLECESNEETPQMSAFD